jgi:aminobenzoyl-glutamate utilization protein B
VKYQPLLRPEDTPALDLNRDIMERHRPGMRRYYYNSRRYRTYLEQLGVRYPTLPDGAGECRVTVRAP